MQSQYSAFAILPSHLYLIADALGAHARGELGQAEAREMQALMGADRGRPLNPQGVAIVGIYGILTYRGGFLQALFGGTSVEGLLYRVRLAMADSSVGAILLDCDSPGGEVAGIMETAEEIFRARKVKRIVAVSNTMMASAAYWLGSAASEVYASPSAETGGIGVYAVHSDHSGELQKKGIKMTLIGTPARKTEGNPYEPLDPDARAYIQGRVNDIAGDFSSAVARYRGITTAEVQAKFGEGRVLGARKARAMGLVDDIATFTEVLDRLTDTSPMGRARALAAEIDYRRRRLRLASR